MRVLSPLFACASFCRSILLDRSLVLLGCVSLCGFSLPMSAQTVTFAGPSPSVNFGNVNLCVPGAARPAPCSETLTLTYNVTAGGTLGTPKVVTQGSPNLDFTLAGGSTCTGTVTAGKTCTVQVNFAPRYAGSRPGGVLVTGAGGKVIATTLIYGYARGPQIAFQASTPVELPLAASIVNSLTTGIAVDGAGDLFLTTSNFEVLKLPADGGAPVSVFSYAQVFPPIYPSILAIDGAGDLFVPDENLGFIHEQPAGGGDQIQFPFPGQAGLLALATDAVGDLFGAESEEDRDGDAAYIFKLPVGGGPAVALAVNLPYIYGFAVDGVGNAFASSGNASSGNYQVQLVELPANEGTQIDFTPPEGENACCVLTVDGGGNVLTGLVELPASGGPFIVEPNYGDVIDAAGDFFLFQSASDGYIASIGKYQRSQPPVLNFGTVPLGTAPALSLTITNIGTFAATPKLIVMPSFSNSSYRIGSTEPEGCLGGIDTGRSCQVNVEFDPAAIGVQNASMTLATNGATSPVVSLQGTARLAFANGTNAPILSIPSGVYAAPQTISISDATPGAVIHYTTDGSTPTVSSPTYTGPLSVGSTERISAIAIGPGAPSAIVTAAYTIVTTAGNVISAFSQGFAYPGFSSLTTNYYAGQPVGAALQLATPNFQNEEGSAFYDPVNIQSFTTDFAFRLSASADSIPLSEIADGITFTIQNASPSSIGSFGGGLGYAGIGKSVAVKFDLDSNAGEGPDSTGLYVDGAEPTVPSIDLSGTGLDLHSGHAFLAQITYDGSNLVLTLTDTVTLLSYSHSFAIDIPATVGSDTAFVGFTGGTGNRIARLEILNWTYVSGPPGPPVPPPPAAPALPGFDGGFNAVGLTTNGSVTLLGSALQLTSGSPNDAGSAFYSTPLNIQRFTSDFTFHLVNPVADGFTFIIQNGGAKALGGIGGYLGYGGIPKSVAIKFDLFSNDGEGSDSTGVYVNGAPPTVPDLDLTGTGINLHSGDFFAAHVTYDGTSLVLALTDTVTGAVWSHSQAIDIPSVIGSDTALVGFTGATGGLTSTQQILNWNFTNP